MFFFADNGEKENQIRCLAQASVKRDLILSLFPLLESNYLWRPLIFSSVEFLHFSTMLTTFFTFIHHLANTFNLLHYKFKMWMCRKQEIFNKKCPELIFNRARLIPRSCSAHQKSRKQYNFHLTLCRNFKTSVIYDFIWVSTYVDFRKLISTSHLNQRDFRFVND